jgi:hypothetical protein
MEIKSNPSSLPVDRSEYMPSQVVSNNPLQPGAIPFSSPQAPSMNQVDPQYNVANLQAFQL